MSDLPLLPFPTVPTTHFCNKCGYIGEIGESHPGCDYLAASSGPYWNEEGLRAAIASRDEEIARLRSLLKEARAEVEFWTPDECNAKASEERFLDLWYALRDRIDAALKTSE